MQTKAAVREIMESKGVGPTVLADRLGKSQRLISDRLGVNKSTNLSMDTLVEMLRVLDYKVVLVPRETRVGEGWYEVE